MASEVNLQPGKKAPAFSGKDQNGNTIRLKDFLGKKVILYFYPRDLTATCTVQACNLRDTFPHFNKKGVEVIGISTDDEATHQKFIARNNLPFTLVADVDQKIHLKYGVWRLKKFMGREFMGTIRTTFLINEQGYIDHIITKPKSKEHAEEIKKLWGL